MRDEITAGLEPLFEKATREKLWFYWRFQGIWLSPEELRAEQARGFFRFGACNWELLDPAKKLAELEQLVCDTKKEIESLKKRMSGNP